MQSIKFEHASMINHNMSLLSRPGNIKEPVKASNKHVPRLHMSTAIVWSNPSMISGAR
jgi:hypothetical protein